MAAIGCREAKADGGMVGVVRHSSTRWRSDAVAPREVHYYCYCCGLLNTQLTQARARGGVM